MFGSHIFVPISWMCKKQTSVSSSSIESEIISLDAGLRLDGIPALDLWHLIVAVLHRNTYQSNKWQGDLCRHQREVRAVPHTLQKRKKSHGMIDDLNNIDFISSNFNSSRQEALLYVFEDNEEVVIKMITKRRNMFPDSTELLLIDCSIESIWVPKCKSNTSTSKINSQTYWQREFSHVMNGIIFCVCSTLVISVLPMVLKWCRKERKKI